MRLTRTNDERGGIAIHLYVALESDCDGQAKKRHVSS